MCLSFFSYLAQSFRLFFRTIGMSTEDLRTLARLHEIYEQAMEEGKTDLWWKYNSESLWWIQKHGWNPITGKKVIK